jgi:hypothetical protein
MQCSWYEILLKSPNQQHLLVLFSIKQGTMKKVTDERKPSFILRATSNIVYNHKNIMNIYFSFHCQLSLLTQT